MRERQGAAEIPIAETEEESVVIIVLVGSSFAAEGRWTKRKVF